jgi:hypothetical protein
LSISAAVLLLRLRSTRNHFRPHPYQRDLLAAFQHGWHGGHDLLPPHGGERDRVLWRATRGQSFSHHQHLRIYPMMGSGPVADTRSVEQVQSLLAIIADPKAAKAALAQLADAQKSADEKLAAANAKAADLDGREASISSREAAVAKGEIKLAAAVQKQKESADAMNADLTARIEAVTAREIAVSKVDNANAEREVSVSNREAAIAAKETNLQASYDEANAAKRKYDEALENLRSLVSQ